MLTDTNKAAVRRFNEEVIAAGNRAVFEALVAPDFINRSASPGMVNGPESMWNTFENMLRPALSGLKVIIHDQIAQGDLVTTRKTISGQHTGQLMDVAATHKIVSIDVIDIVRLEDGRYVEHWGLNTLSTVLAALRGIDS
ncbi:ester cyclase [Novosphingobium sp. AP12]|uniref:ester cyclase n=1 Tax=Novosphingobium sp. AP12 TaxID=1144305 RepID=UPI00027200BA|nr:ester cyclase [Novosphingobium sp. AP12]EJL22750.1 putative ester cyclase [Novosphingobium sp. AP12]